MILYSRIKVMGVILHIWALGNCIMAYRQSWPCFSFFITDYYIITTSEVIFALQTFGSVVHFTFPNQLGVGSILLPPHIYVSVCLEQEFSLRFIYIYIYISHLNPPITSCVQSRSSPLDLYIYIYISFEPTNYFTLLFTIYLDTSRL